jgi:hypothetical protein
MDARETLHSSPNLGSEKGGVTKGTAQIWPSRRGHAKDKPLQRP